MSLHKRKSSEPKTVSNNDNSEAPTPKDSAISLERELLKTGQSPYRIFCVDIASEIVRNPWFNIRVTFVALIAAAALTAAFFGIWGRGIEAEVSANTSQLKSEALKKVEQETSMMTEAVKIFLSKEADSVNTRITEQFKTERIQDTIKLVAENQL